MTAADWSQAAPARSVDAPHERGPWLTAIALVLPLLVLALTAAFALQQSGPAQDEGAFLLYGDRILHGAVAHQDFQTFYGPAMPWVLAAFSFGGGPNLWMERAVGLVDVLLVVLLITAVAANWGRLQATTSGVLAAAILAQTEPFATPWFAAIAFALGSLVTWRFAMSRGDGERVSLYGLAGAFASIAVTFRIDLAPVLMLAVIPLAARRSRGSVWFIGGAVAGLLPLAAHIVIASPAAVWQNIVVDGLRASTGRRLPVPPTTLTERAALLLTLAAAALIVAAAAVSLYHDRNSIRARLLTSLAVLSVGVMPEMFQRADLPHILDAACVSGALVPVSVTVLIERFRLPRPRALTRSFAGACVLAGGLWTIQSVRVLHSSVGTQVSNAGRDFMLTAREAPDARAVLADVQRIARPRQRLFVGPMDMRRTNYNATDIYYLLPQLVPATYYLEMEPLTANQSDSRLASDVASADVLVLTTEWDDWKEPNASSQFGSDRPNQVVAELFCQRAHDGVYRVFTRCGAS